MDGWIRARTAAGRLNQWLDRFGRARAQWVRAGGGLDAWIHALTDGSIQHTITATHRAVEERLSLSVLLPRDSVTAASSSAASPSRPAGGLLGVGVAALVVVVEVSSSATRSLLLLPPPLLVVLSDAIPWSRALGTGDRAFACVSVRAFGGCSQGGGFSGWRVWAAGSVRVQNRYHASPKEEERGRGCVEACV